MESIRTCLVCRKKAAKALLCRFVRALDGEICFDEKSVLDHRGAWLCPNRICISKAFEKRLLFKGEKTLPTQADAMLEFVKSRISSGILGNLGLLRRMGKIEAGKDASLHMLNQNNVSALVFAKDFSERSVNDVLKVQPERKDLFVFKSSFLMEEIGKSLGRKKTGVVALGPSRITDDIVRKLEKLKELEQ